VSSLLWTSGDLTGAIAGSVTTQNDDDSICIVVELDEGVLTSEVHLYVGGCDVIPTTADGDYDHTSFNYNTGPIDATGSVTISISRDELPFAAGDCFCIAVRVTIGDDAAWADGEHQPTAESLTRAFDYCLQECCYEDESAWADGERYAERGNWATYTDYDSVAMEVILYAGQTLEAGIVSFSDVVDGEVMITITLNENWQFDDISGNVKIQGYDEEPPAGNPAPGQFDYHFDAVSSPFTATVEVAAFYGIHVDLLHEVPCPE
jgi:hypothetical protein